MGSYHAAAGERQHYSGLAHAAEQAGQFQRAADHWRTAASLAHGVGLKTKYSGAAKRCDDRARGTKQ